MRSSRCCEGWAARIRTAIYCLDIGGPLFDQFFNSVNGYRGWYFASPEHGIEMNAYLLQALTPLLIASGKLTDPPERIHAGLRSSQAKAWLTEVGKEPDRKCRTCSGEWNGHANVLGEIQNGRWEHATDGVRRWGRCAPYLTKVRVFGGFVNDGGEVWAAPSKVHRADDIHGYGWS